MNGRTLGGAAAVFAVIAGILVFKSVKCTDKLAEGMGVANEKLKGMLDILFIVGYSFGRW